MHNLLIFKVVNHHVEKTGNFSLACILVKGWGIFDKQVKACTYVRTFIQRCMEAYMEETNRQVVNEK